MIATVRATRPNSKDGHNIELACTPNETDEQIIERCKSFLKSDYEKKIAPNFNSFTVTKRVG